MTKKENVLPPFQGEKSVVFLAILAVARMVIWTTRQKGLYDDASFSNRDLVYYFGWFGWLLRLMAYQLFLGYLMPKPFS